MPRKSALLAGKSTMVDLPADGRGHGGDPPTPRFDDPLVWNPGESEKLRGRAFDQPRFPLSPIFLADFWREFWVSIGVEVCPGLSSGTSTAAIERTA